jgi:hypothetical protein
MLNEADVVPVRGGDEEAVSVYPLPTFLIDRSLNVATPFTAVLVSVPVNVPGPGFAPSATVTCVVLSDATTTLPEFWTCTVTEGEIGLPDTVVEG